jgi:hypothetical protein
MVCFLVTLWQSIGKLRPVEPVRLRRGIDRDKDRGRDDVKGRT